MTSLNEMPSGGTTNLGMWNGGDERTCSGISSVPIRGSGGQHHRALDHVLQLADVARPVVLHQQVERRSGQLETGFAVLLAVLREEVLREQRDVVLPLAQRRQVDADDVQAVEEVLAEAPVLDHLPADRSWWPR